MALAIAESDRLADTAALSGVCEGLGALRNARRGGWRIAQEHLRVLTNGRCRFFADTREESPLYSAVNLRLDRIRAFNAKALPILEGMGLRATPG